MTREELEQQIVLLHLEVNRLRDELARAWTEIYRLTEHAGRGRTPLDRRGQMLPKRDQP